MVGASKSGSVIAEWKLILPLWLEMRCYAWGRQELALIYHRQHVHLPGSSRLNLSPLVWCGTLYLSWAHDSKKGTSSSCCFQKDAQHLVVMMDCFYIFCNDNGFTHRSNRWTASSWLMEHGMNYQRFDTGSHQSSLDLSEEKFPNTRQFLISNIYTWGLPC